MTKLKNTKKGMAKKALSISLVAAMLATSNVPVWAAEFSDGTDVAPVVVEQSEDVDVFSDNGEAEPAAIVEDVAPAAEEPVMTATDADINIDGYVSTIAVRMNGSGWGNPVSVTGSLKTKSGSDVYTWDDADKNREIQVGYTWLSDGLEANTNDSVNNPSSAVLKAGYLVNTIKYTPSRDDFDKNLSLMVYVKRGNTVVYQQTFNGGTVGAQDISTEFAEEIKLDKEEYTYNGKEQKPVPINEYNVETAFGSKITQKHITWHYEQQNNDFTNVTGNNPVTVTGTLDGTYDPTSEAYGYTATIDGDYAATYKITPLEITADNLEAAMKTTSVQYTGADQKFGKSDVTLQVKVGNNKVDITDALKNDCEFTGDVEVGTGYKLEISTDKLANTAEAQKILSNFEITTEVTATTTNSYSIVARNLSKCTGEVNKDFNVEDIKGKNADQLTELFTNSGDKITLKGEDGKTFTLADIKGSVSVTVEQSLISAADKGNTGVVNNAITISYKADTKNVTGKISLPVRLTTRNLNEVDIKVNGNLLSDSASKPTDLGLKYIGTAYDLEAKKYGIESIEVSGVDIKSGEYKITYSDNVNAGTVKVTLTGLGSYAGSVKNFYFKINTVDVDKNSISMEDKVSLNSANNTDASKYKDALNLSIKQELKDIKNNVVGKATLELDKDYSVKYYYTTRNESGADYNDEQEVKKNLSTNKAGNWVCAVVTIKKGNYTEDVFVKHAEIVKKSISNVKVDIEKDSYTFTGKQIVPEVVVKDGSSVLEKGVDYSILVKDNINVGTATVTIKALDGSEYEAGSTTTATFKITPAKAEDVKVTLAKSTSAEPVSDLVNTFKYRKGKQIKPTVEKIELNGVDVTKNFDTDYLTYGENTSAGKEMGSVVVSPKTDNKNFTGTKTQLFDIKGDELNGTLSVYGADKKRIPVGDDNIVGWEDYHFFYSGKECTFADEAFIANPAAAKEGTDYEIKYINNVDAGFGFVAVVAKGNYEGNKTLSFSVYDENGNPIKDKDGNTITTNDWVDNYEVVNGKLMQGNRVIQNNIVDIIAFEIGSSVFTAKNVTVSNGVYASGLPVKPQVTVSVAGKTLVEGTDYKLNIRPQDTDTNFSYPDSVINATNGKPFYVDVVPMAGYSFDWVDGSNTFAWGIDQFDFAAADVQYDGKNVTVKNGTIVVDPSDYVVTTDEKAGTITVSAKEGSKNYKGSQTIKADSLAEHIGAPMIKDVQVVGNKATVILSGEAEGATGYDYVISTENNYDKAGRLTNGINKNRLTTETTYQYVQQGVYYAYCHAWTRDASGKKVFGAWSNIYPFSVSAITPDQPSLTSVKVSGSTVTVTYTKCANATGYDIVLGSAQKKVNGELRPVEYGTLVKKVKKGNTVTATFKNVPKGTYYVGLHSWNRTSENGKKVFSPWSNTKKVNVK